MSQLPFVGPVFGKRSVRRVVAGIGAGAVAAGLLVALPQPARAQPGTAQPRIPGAGAAAPKQAAGSAANRRHSAPAATVTGTHGAATRTPAPGAVGTERTFPAPRIPAATAAKQTVTPQASRPQGYVAGLSREMPAERTPSSTVFANPDGTRTLRIYSRPVYVPRQGGTYTPVNGVLHSDGGGRLVPAAAAPVSIAARADDPMLAQLRTDGGAVGYRLAGASPVAATTTGGGARFAGVREHADLVLTPTVDGLKESIVLGSAAAPTTWRFPLLSTDGLTPTLDQHTGEVRFTDQGGTVQAVVPQGFMVDSNIDPHSGAGATSHGVGYALERTATGWTLRIDLDATWLRDPARRFPVTVDPTLRRNTEADDTYASSRDWLGSDASGDDSLKVGTFDGTEKDASYLHFNGVMSSLANRYILGATLNLYNNWSYSCRPYPMTVYRVTAPWSGSGVRSFPGPAYDGAKPVASANFAHGYDSCSADTWVTLGIPADRMTRWVHGLEPFYGFTLRSSTASKDSWKRFASANYPSASAIPFMDVNYADQGVGYVLPDATFIPPVTATSAGRITVRLTNWGSATWTPTNGYKLTYAVLNSAGTVVQNGPQYAVPQNAVPHQSVDVAIDVGPVAPGNYTLRLDMVDPSNRSFHATYGAPYGVAGFTVANGAPTINGNYPANNAHVDTLRPTLFASYYDPDSYPVNQRRFSFQVCAGTPAAPGACAQSGLIDNAAWQVPEDVLGWGRPAYWYVTVSDTVTSSPRIGPLFFTPDLPQPEITGHLSGAPDGSDIPGVNPNVGNYATTAVDAAVQVAGPKLDIERTYNSQDPRTDGFFGAGWSSPLEERLTEEDGPLGGPSVLLTTDTGRQLRFGQDGSGGYVSPAGESMTLVWQEDTLTWVLRDRTGYRRVFDWDGNLVTVIDADGRAQAFHYGTAAGPVTVTDETSGRSLHLTWTGGHITGVAADPPAPGQPAPTWTYTYTGKQLTTVCGPLSAQSCTGYTYQSTSGYRAAVTGDSPAAYWPLDDSSGSVANDVVARGGDHDGTYSGATLGAPGALASSGNPGITLPGTAQSGIALPVNTLNTSIGAAYELWFKAAAGESGVLLGEQDTPLGVTPTNWVPMMYVGTDGFLRAQQWTTGSVGAVHSGLAGKCLDLRDGETDDGTPVISTTCDGGWSQTWTVRTDGAVQIDGNCVDVLNHGTTVTSKIVLMTCNGSASQVWQQSGGALRNPVSGFCLDVTGASTVDGTQLQLATCNGQPQQQWAVPWILAPMHSAARVDDGQWHHAVLNQDEDGQNLYVDGTMVDDSVNPNPNAQHMGYAYLGNGHTAGSWPGGSSAATDPFAGSLDEVAYYRHPLTDDQVSGHFGAARAGTARLTGTVEPGNFTANTIGYDDATGRVGTLTDRNGATWTLGAPVLGDGLRSVTINSTVRDAITYAYDTEHGGRLVARTDGAGSTAREYNAAGFVTKETDQNGDATTYDTDARGNVTGRTTCRTTSACGTEYFGYFLNAADPLDPRNDVQVWHADARSSGPGDTTYRTTQTLDAAGHVTAIQHPVPAGRTSAPTQAFAFSSGAGYTVASAARGYVSADTVLALTGDDAQREVTLPFPVPFYGRAYTALRVATNGYASFTAPGEAYNAFDAEFDNLPLPVLGMLPGTLFPFWTDLVVDTGSSVRTAVTGTAPDRTFVVEWRNLCAFNATDDECGPPISFELGVAESGAIWFNYSGVAAGWPHSATVGIQNAAGLVGAQYHTAPVSGTAVTFTPTTAAGSAPVPGLALTATGTNGGVTSYTYNGAGDVASSTDPVGLVTTVDHDNLGRATSVTRSAGGTGFGTLTYTYNAGSLPATITAPAVTDPVTGAVHRAVDTNSYDAAGRLTRVDQSDTSGGDATRTLRWGYDPAGRLVSSTDPAGTVSTQSYDAAGNVSAASLPGGLHLEYAYDDARHNVEVDAVGAGVDPMDPAATRLTLESRAYDPAGRLVSIVDSMGRETGYTYYNDNLPVTAARVRRDASGAVTGTTDLLTFGYDAAGNQTSVTTAGGVTTSYAYDPAGYRTAATFDPGGLNRLTSYANNPDGSVASRTLSGGGRSERTDFGYDAAGRLLTSTVHNEPAASLVTTLVRDPRGLVVSVTDPTGAASTSAYDALDRLSTSTGPARTTWVGGVRTDNVSPVTTYGYDTFGDTTSVRDPNGAVTRTAVDALGRPTAVTRPAYTPPGGAALTAVDRTSYDPRGLPLTMTDALGHVTTLAYDLYGDLTSRTQPDPDGAGPKSAPVWNYGYDRDGEQLSATDPGGAQHSATYDDLGRQLTDTVTDRTGGTTGYLTTTLGYDAADNLTTVTSPLGHVTTYAYDKAREQTRVTDPDGRFQQFGYDVAGRTVSSASGQGSAFTAYAGTATYDLAGRQTGQSQCAATATGGCGSVLRTATQAYDGAGRVVARTTPAGRTTTAAYDAAGELTAVTQRADAASAASAVTVQLGYDRTGLRTRMVDGNGNATDYGYNPWGLPESTVEPSTTANPGAADRTWTLAYDAAGQVTSQRQPGGITQTRSYDGLGRLTGEDATGAAPRRFDYDALGRLVRSGGPTGDSTFGYNDRGMLTGSAGAAGTSAYGFDADGRLVGRTDAAGAGVFGYTDGGLLRTAADPLTGRTASYTYTASGQLSSVGYGTGTPSRTYTYDNLDRVATDTWKAPDASTVASTAYTYDNDDLLRTRVTSGLAGAGSNAYDYDGIGRLTGWTGPSGGHVTYGYDSASNRTAVTSAAGTRTSAYDTRDRLTGSSGAGQPAVSYTWAARGTLAGDSTGTAYSYDAFDRLTQVAPATGAATSYSYDSLDRVAQRNGVGGTYDGLTNNAVTTPGGGATVFRDPAGAALSDRTGGGAARVLLADAAHLDLAAAADPSTGAVSGSKAYDPFGAVTAASGTLPLGFQGGWTDPATGDTATASRWYDPATGFGGRDTLTLDPNSVADTNRYAYAGADPVNATDPSGHCPVCLEILGDLWIDFIYHNIINPPHAGAACKGPRGERPDAGHWLCNPDNWCEGGYTEYCPSGQGHLGVADSGGYGHLGRRPGGGGKGGDDSGKCRTDCGPPPVAPRPTFDPNLHTRPPTVDLTDGKGIRNPTVPTEPTPDEDPDEDPGDGDDSGDSDDPPPDFSVGCKAYVIGDRDNGPGAWTYRRPGGPARDPNQNRAWMYQMYITGVCPGFEYEVPRQGGRDVEFDGHVSHAEGGFFGAQLMEAKGPGYAKLLGQVPAFIREKRLAALAAQAQKELDAAPKSYPVVWYVAEEEAALILRNAQLRGKFPPGVSIIYRPCPESVCG